MAESARNRTLERTGVPDKSRLRLLEGDADQLERKIDDGLATLNVKLDRVNARLLGLALTIAASAVVFALTVLAGGH